MSTQLVHYSDVGPVRASNQDAYCAFIANTAAGSIALVAVCDGMGGLSSGEVASATVIQGFADWFCVQLPLLVQDGALRPEELFASWNRMLQDCHNRLKQAAAARQIRWGTTLSVVLLTPDSYYLLHVGDSRAYLEGGGALQLLTRDQTLAMRELEAGSLPAEQYAQDPRRNVLLQCIGDHTFTPDFRIGERPDCGAVLLCSDGFYHTVQPQELHTMLAGASDRNNLQQQVTALAARARDLGETDNITAVIFRWDDTPSERHDTLALPSAGNCPATDMNCVAKVVSLHARPL